MSLNKLSNHAFEQRISMMLLTCVEFRRTKLEAPKITLSLFGSATKLRACPLPGERLGEHTSVVYNSGPCIMLM